MLHRIFLTAIALALLAKPTFAESDTDSVRLVTFNLYQYLAPPAYWYEAAPRNRYSEKSWEAKQTWIKEHLVAMDADIIGFQEVFSADKLKKLVAEIGYPHFATVDETETSAENPNVFVKPLVALASRYPIREVNAVALDPEVKAGLPLKDDFHFSRVPIQAVVETPLIPNLRVYVAHLKSKRPLAKLRTYPEETSWEERTQDTMKRLSQGNIASLLQRGAEASFLYHAIIADLIADPVAPIVVLGDLNDDEDSIVLRALTLEDRIYEIGEIPQSEWPRGVSALTHRYRLADAFRFLPKDAQADRAPTHVYRGKGGTLDYVLVSNALNAFNPRSTIEVTSFRIYNEHILGGSNKLSTSDHGQVLIELGRRRAETENSPAETAPPQ